MLSKLKWRVRDLRTSSQVRRQAALWRCLVTPGSVAFDVGANRGEMTRSLLLAGARQVVAVEPQPRLASLLRSRFSDGQVSVFEGVLSEPGRVSALLRVGSSSVLASVDSDFIDRTAVGRFRGHHWSDGLEVPCLTWDALVDRFGRPSFAKIDVEGHEDAVLRGLTVPPTRGLCVEIMSELSHRLPLIIDRLSSVGLEWFNFSRGDEFALDATGWRKSGEAAGWLGSLLASETAWGDVYAIATLDDLTLQASRVGDSRRES